jgi:hypothetical protein
MADSATLQPVPPPGADRPDGDPQVWRHINDALRGLQFGTVTLIVQDGLVIQVDRTEKRRLPRRADRRA